MHRQFGYVSSCTVTYSEGTASVSCEDSTSSVSGHQVILLQQNNNNLIVETIRSGKQVSLPVPRGRYCIMEQPLEDNELVYSEVKYSSEFIAEDKISTAVGTSKITSATTGTISSFACKNNAPNFSNCDFVCLRFCNYDVGWNLSIS